MNVLGLKVIGHDTGAALISDQRVVAIAEERLTRIKHSVNTFPELSIRYCLDTLGVRPEEVDLVVIDQVITNHEMGIDSAELFRQKMGKYFPGVRIEVVNHHDAHAASAFFCSPFEEAAILVYDGAGEGCRNHLGVVAVETETLYRGAGSRFYQIQKTAHIKPGRRFPYTFGVGKLYEVISASYVNLGLYNEGKMMGLAPYGNDSVLRQLPADRWFTERYGHIICNAKVTWPSRSLAERIGGRRGLSSVLTAAKAIAKMRWRSVRLSVEQNIIKRFLSKGVYFEPYVFEELRFSRPARSPSDKLPEDYYSSVAYAAQKILEEVAVSWGKKLKQTTNSKNICIAGGVGLNIDANRNFLDKAGFERLFVQPASSDTGIGLGCALYGWHVLLNQPRFWVMTSAELGRRYGGEEIESALEKYKDRILIEVVSNLAERAAKIIADGKIMGWFRGGAEYGPRALGNRSILCDARYPDMKDTLNNKVKHRESWRPFAAAILRERQSEWFELEHESPFMLLAAPVCKEKRAKIPSVVHVDGTCRIQSVTKEANGTYYDLINEFYKITGVPLILNTSFNLAGDPIVETPEDALNCFLKTKMDYLVIENYLISKKSIGGI